MIGNILSGRNFRGMLGILLPALLLAPAANTPALAQRQAQNATRNIPPTTDTRIRNELARRAAADLKPFYATRGWRPLWLTPNGTIRPAGQTLLDQINTADVDGLKPKQLKNDDLAKALSRAASGTPEDLARAEIALSKAFVGYVKALRGARRAEMVYETEALAPMVPITAVALQDAARDPSLDAYVSTMRWMHPLYVPLRKALANNRLNDAQRRQLTLNLERVRALPADPAPRYVLIDAASARLWMYENGQPVDSMRVVVGKPDQQTPMMAGFLRYAILNPYWNIPDDLVQQRIAPNVLSKGARYLKASGYQVLNSFDDDASLINPATVNWRSVANGKKTVHVRQLPGPDNFMGRVKFMFPNALGIYLHDTPDKDLMLKDQRQLSSGCVRLEDADRLGRWLLAKPLPRRVRKPEQRVELPELVPVYISYFTAMPKDGLIAFHPDPYRRDGNGPTTMAQAR
jgi:murein L,D-transpeptidase YcbB/YkuD